MPLADLESTVETYNATSHGSPLLWIALFAVLTLAAGMITAALLSHRRGGK